MTAGQARGAADDFADGPVEWNPREDAWEPGTILCEHSDSRLVLIELADNKQQLVVEKRHLRRPDGPGREALEALTADVLALADELDAAWQREHDRRYDPNRLQYAEGACDALDDAEQRLRRLVARHGQEARDGS